MATLTPNRVAVAVMLALFSERHARIAAASAAIGRPIDAHEVDLDLMRAAIEQVAEYAQTPGSEVLVD
ncbi:MAG: hypothetical protein N2C14_30460 [Planctomycetales bacterium]